MMVADYTNPANINETVAEIRDQSGPEDETSSGINFSRQRVTMHIDTAFDKRQWQETKYGSPRSLAPANDIFEHPARDPTKQVPWQILRRHGSMIMTDSTPLYERHATYFRNGSYQEFTNDGVRFKARGDMDHIVTGDQQMYIKKTNTLTVGGENWLLVKADAYHEWKQTVYEKVHESVVREILDTIEEKVGIEVKQEIGKLKTVTVPNEVHEIGIKHKLQSAGDSVLCPDYGICPVIGKKHALINGKVEVV